MPAAVQTLTDMAVEVLTTADGRAKTALSHRHAAAWFAARAAGTPLPVGDTRPPAKPAPPKWTSPKWASPKWATSRRLCKGRKGNPG